MASFDAFLVVFYAIYSYKRVNKRPGKSKGARSPTRPHFKPCVKRTFVYSNRVNYSTSGHYVKLVF